MPKWETKLKLGRKLDDVDNATASDNQLSALFRYDEQGADRHVSLSIESDVMKADDVAAVLALLERRGILTKMNSKVWVSQPQASESRFGPTNTWQGADVAALADRAGNMTQPTVPPPSPGAAPDASLAKLREAERRVADLERAVAAMKAALAGAAPVP